MTRWALLLEALGVTPGDFELQHRARFDLSPRAWVKDRARELLTADFKEVEENALAAAACQAPCCEEPA